MPLPARRAVGRPANSHGGSTEHLVLGLGLTAAAVLGSALVARLLAPAADRPEAIASRQAQPAFSAAWPPLFLALTVSGLRIWNAPRSPARTQALTLWGAVQALNAIWMALGPRRLGGRLATAVASFGSLAAYVWRARQVTPPAARLVPPYLGWIGVAGALSEELWRKGGPRPTIH